MDKDIKFEKDCTHLVSPRESYSIEEYERIVKEAIEIYHVIDLHTYQMDIDIAPYAGNAFLDGDAEQMEFFKGFHRALVMMREYVDEKSRPLLLKEYKAEEKKTYAAHVEEQMATLLPHDHRLLDDIVRGLYEEGWQEEGGSPTFRLLCKPGAAIKIFRDADAPQVIKICFSAEPEHEVSDEREEAEKPEKAENAL